MAGRLEARFLPSNWPFAVKFAVPGLLALLVIIFVAVLAQRTINGLSRDLDQVVERKFNASILLANSVSRLGAANGALYQMQTRQAAGLPIQIDAEARAVTATIDTVISDLHTFEANYASEEDRKKVDAAIQNLTTYKEAVGFVASMLEIDFKATVNFLAPLAKSYDEMTADLTAISAQFLTDSRRQSQEALIEAAAAKRLLYGVSVPVLLATVLITLMVAFATVQSVRHVAATTQRLAEGDTAVDLTRLQRGDELGHVVSALEVFRDNTDKMTVLRAEREHADATARQSKRDGLLALARDLEREVGTVVADVAATTERMLRQSDELLDSAAAMAAQAKEAVELSNETLIEARNSTERTQEMYAAINQISEQVTNTAGMASDAVEEMDGTRRTIDGLAVAAVEIGKVADVIKVITGRTKLLALNAAIEAARAGDAGRGFNIVANEVKALAGQTEVATNEIAQNLTSVQAETRTTVQSFANVQDVVRRMSEVAILSAAAVEEQHATTREINRAIEAAGNRTEATARILENTQRAAEHTGSAMSSMAEGLRALHSKTGSLRDSMAAFLRMVTAE